MQECIGQTVSWRAMNALKDSTKITRRRLGKDLGKTSFGKTREHCVGKFVLGCISLSALYYLRNVIKNLSNIFDSEGGILV